MLYLNPDNALEKNKGIHRMNKDRWKEYWEWLKPRLAFLKPWDMDEDVGDDLEVREMSSFGRQNSWGSRAETPRERTRRRRYAIITLTALLAIVAGCFLYYNGHHSFTEYVVTSTTENLDIVGTEYTMLGNYIVKYSSDGVFCVNSHNEVRWSAAYSMQTPIIDMCGQTMVIAQQQGRQVYVVNEDGLLGSFTTSLSILKAHVSKQGVVVLILEDSDVTWIEMYDVSGNEIAKIKTTLQDSGYPLDVAITPNASRMIVSYLGVSGRTLCSRIAFYDFSSASDSDESHLTGTLDYTGQVFPEVYYADASTPVALSDTGFVVFKNKKTPEEETSVVFEKEIVSSFHDSDNIGFIFNNEAADCRYEMELYHYNGKMAMRKEFDCNYTQVRMDRGEILLYDAKNCTVYTASGTRRFSSDYEKQVEYFAKIPGFRRYIVITNDSLDRIRIS